MPIVFRALLHARRALFRACLWSLLSIVCALLSVAYLIIIETEWHTLSGDEPFGFVASMIVFGLVSIGAGHRTVRWFWRARVRVRRTI